MPMSYLPAAEEARDSQLLRASVIEAAMTLGSKVTDWIFDNRAIENHTEGGYRDELPILALSSSSSSDESHSFDLSSHDGHSSEFGIVVHRSRLQIPLPQSLGSDISATLEDDHYLDSPFVMINEDNLPMPCVLAYEAKSVSQRKSIKNFRFGRKRIKNAGSVLDVKKLSISAPRAILPCLDDPVFPSFLPGSEGSIPESSPIGSNTPLNSSGSNTHHTTPIKRPKTIRECRDWDFKDPDRPSFFLQQQYEFDKYDGKDAGYASEGTGSRFRSGREGGHNLEIYPLKRSMTDRIRQTRKWFFTDLRDYDPHPKSISKSMPAKKRFSRKQPQSGESTNPSPSSNSGRKSSLLTTASSSQRRSISTSSASSFALFPDLNVAKRLRLDKYTSNRGENTSGHIGVDNKVKLEMLARLLNERPPPPNSTAVASARKGLAPPSTPSQSAPSCLNIAPLDRESDEYHSPHSVNSPIVTVQGPSVQRSRSPLPVCTQQTQSPVRGREAPFPTKPIFRMTPHSRTLPPQLLAPPQRYLNVDVPRSVRSTFTKDLDLEDKKRDEEDRRQSREDNAPDDISVYSNYSKVVDDDAESKASLMDAERSKGIRAMLMKSLSEFDNKRAYF